MSSDEDEPQRKISCIDDIHRSSLKDVPTLQNLVPENINSQATTCVSVTTDCRMKSTARKSFKEMRSRITTPETRKISTSRSADRAELCQEFPVDGLTRSTDFANKIRLEICADNISSVINAAEGGADRIELCQELSVGGLTPSAGFIAQSKLSVNIPIYVLVRPRSGDFCYTEPEIRIMEDDIKNSINFGAEGFVIGALTRSGEVDVEVCRRLLDKTRGFPVTFHRAFDLTRDPVQALDCLIDLKFQRILTSGQAKTALEGLPLIQNLISRTRKIIIMAGCGITPNNVKELLNNSDIREFHSSAKIALNVESVDVPIVQGTASYNITDVNSVKKMKEIADAIGKERAKILYENTAM